MEVKCLEVRDAGTFIPVIAIRPVADNPEQLYLLQRDGYDASLDETCIILVRSHANFRDGGNAQFDAYEWPDNPRTMRAAHILIEKHWDTLKDGSVVDVEFLLGETKTPKQSERLKCPKPTLAS